MAFVSSWIDEYSMTQIPGNFSSKNDKSIAVKTKKSSSIS
jgi:hypothetical protein